MPPMIRSTTAAATGGSPAPTCATRTQPASDCARGTTGACAMTSTCVSCQGAPSCRGPCCRCPSGETQASSRPLASSAASRPARASSGTGSSNSINCHSGAPARSMRLAGSRHAGASGVTSSPDSRRWRSWSSRSRVSARVRAVWSRAACCALNACKVRRCASCRPRRGGASAKGSRTQSASAAKAIARSSGESWRACNPCRWSCQASVRCCACCSTASSAWAARSTASSASAWLSSRRRWCSCCCHCACRRASWCCISRAMASRRSATLWRNCSHTTSNAGASSVASASSSRTNSGCPACSASRPSPGA